MGQLQFFPDQRPLPAHLLALVEDAAWGRVGQALLDGLSANLKVEGGDTLFGVVLNVLAHQGDEGQTSAAYGPLALLDTFLDRGLTQEAPGQLTTVVQALAAGQWHWATRLLERGHSVELPGGRAALFALIEGRMFRRLQGLEDQEWGDGLNAISQAKFNPDTQQEIAAVHRMVVDLCAHGANLEALDDDESAEYPTTPMILSVLYGDQVMIEALLAAGASIDAPWVDDSSENYMGQMHPIALSAKEGCAQILDVLLGHAGLDILGVYGADAMHVAVARNHVDCLDVLFSHGIAYDALSRADGFHALHQAALHGHKESIDWLLSKGEKWDVSSETGVTPGAVLTQFHPALARMYGISAVANIIPLRPA
jgi:hypothetical protein